MIEAMDWQALMPEGQPMAAGTVAPAHETHDQWEQFPPETPICSHLVGRGESSNINALSNLFPLFPVFPPSEVSLGLNGNQNAPGMAGRPLQIRAREHGGKGLLADDRRTCGSCRNLDDRACSEARPGGLVSARRWYEPPADMLQRCRGYAPLPADPDQRRGIDRWPGL